MKRLLVVIVLSITLLFSCTKPLDNIVILKVKDKSSDTSLITSENTTVSSEVTDDQSLTTTTVIVDTERLLIINKSSKKIHLSAECSYAGQIMDKNKVSAPYAELGDYLQNGYEICSYCEKHY